MAKRLFDMTVAALGLVLLFPLLAMVAIIVYLNIGSPVLFRQLRPGIHGRPLGSGQWSQQDFLGKKVRAGCVVCG